MIKTKRKLSRQKVNRKRRNRKFKKKYLGNIMLKNLNCQFIGKTLIRMHSDRPMSANIRRTYCMHVVYCTQCMLKSVDKVVYGKKSSTRLQYPYYRKVHQFSIGFRSNKLIN